VGGERSLIPHPLRAGWRKRRPRPSLPAAGEGESPVPVFLFRECALEKREASHPVGEATTCRGALTGAAPGTKINRRFRADRILFA
jgi:hypothetical protein